jgi:hypothetical protein
MGWEQGEARWRFSVPFGKDSRRPIIERTVRSHVIVVIPPFGELCLRLLQRREPLDVEAFVAESALKLAMNPFSTGLPGRMKQSCTPVSIAHISRPANSLPLSTVMLRGPVKRLRRL